MSLLQQIIDGSLVSSERLMQAREFYSPRPKSIAAKASFAAWAKRGLTQPALSAARELAGLSDAELAGLEAEFVGCPMRQPPPWVRSAVTAGVVLLVLAGLGLSLQALTNFGEIATRTLQAAGVACLLVALLFLAVGVLSAFSGVHLDLSYGTTGLYVGRLDEQHPWLYKAVSLTRYKVVEEYRQSTLRGRGPLRGADYVMMCELVQAQEALERVRAARPVAEEFQSLPLTAHALGHEPRLVRVHAARDSSEGIETEMARSTVK